MKPILVYALLWLSFGLVHSLLTTESIKQRLLPALGSLYRISYNLIAVVHIGLVLLIGHSLLSTNRFNFLSSAPLLVLSTLLVVSGGVLMLLALRQYDVGQFSGLSQWRADRNDKTVALEPLRTTGLNRWVRHPLYTGMFIFLWGGAVSTFGFWTALFASVYLVIGAHYEERKLLALYGESYEVYKLHVPAFFSFRARF